jgi:hypothetical protein
MPLPNYHSCRQMDPDEFEPGTFRSFAREIDGKPVTMIGGTHKKTKKFTVQTVRFPTKYWSASKAKAHCHHTFEPSSGK